MPRPYLPSLLVLLLLLSACGGGGGSSSPVAPPAPAPPPPSGGTGGNTGGGNDTPPPPAGPTLAARQAAARLLARGTFGATSAQVDALAVQGAAAWLDEQFQQPQGRHLPIVDRWLDERGFDPGATPPPALFRRWAFFEQVMTAPDPLRQRVAYALAQIFVVSEQTSALRTNPRALASWNDTLLQHSFGNFRDLLLAVTLHPAMGIYLSHVNNARTNPEANTFPDENYAREVMQLFSIGLFQLQPDGSQVLDSSGTPVPTYDNTDIREFSKVFTGLTFAANPATGAPAQFGNRQPVFELPMVMAEEAHEPGSKQLLNGTVLPDGQSGMADIEAAVDNLFNHPNVGPFIGRQLIQRLVMSNPSPAYIARVSAAFAGDGSGARGDMQAVLRAVLLDPEATAAPDPLAAGGPELLAGGSGKVREPLLRWLALFRNLGANSSDGTWPVGGFVAQQLTGQYHLAAPSVFNFYQPDHRPVGDLGDAGLTGPELQITTASTVVGMTNLVAFTLFGNRPADTPDGFATVQLDLSPWQALADDPDTLLDEIDLLFTYGTLSEATRAAVLEIIAPLAGEPELRARTALYLVLTSPDHAAAL